MILRKSWQSLIAFIVMNSDSIRTLKAIINSIGKARENYIVEKDVKKIKKC